MGAVGFLARVELRRRWLRVVVLVLVAGAIGGLVLAAAAGARRSSSSLDRFRRYSRSADVELAVVGEPTSRQVREFERLSGATAVAQLRAYGVLLARLPPLQAGGAPVDATFGTRVDRARLVSGRLADPSAPDEIAIGEAIAGQLHVGVGDTLLADTYSVAQIEAILGGSGDVGALAGPRIRFHVVGIVRRPLDLSDRATSGGLLELSRAFAHKYDGQVGVFGTSLRVRASGDSHDVSKVIRAARQVFGQSVVNAQGLTVETEGARDAIHVLTLALWIVAAVIAIAGAITIGLVLDREIALLDVDGSTLRTIGVTRVQRIATAAPLALLVASGSALLAVMTAVGLSPLLPTGVARRADPDVGIHTDWSVLALGVLAMFALVLGLTLVSAFRATDRRERTARPSRARVPALVTATGGAGMPPTLTSGLRMAVDRGDHARGLPARSAFVGAVLGVAAVTAALVFVPSLDHLATTPRLYGWTWDLALHDSTANTPCGGDDYGIPRVAGAAALSEVCTQNVQLDGHPVAALAFTRLRGVPIRAAVVEGRAPRSLARSRWEPRHSTSWVSASAIRCTRRAGPRARLPDRREGGFADARPVPAARRRRDLHRPGLCSPLRPEPLRALLRRPLRARRRRRGGHRTARGDPAAGTPERTEPTRRDRTGATGQLVPLHVGDPPGHAGSRGVAARADDERPAPPR